MKKIDFYFDSRDGKTKIHAVRYEPEEAMLKEGKPVAVLQIVHGMAEYVERYEETAKFFAERGFVVTGEDHLGHGGSVEEGGIYGYFCDQDPATVLVRDVHRLKKLTQELYPGVPYFLLGHSMGSLMVRDYISRYGRGIQGAILMGSGNFSQAQMAVMKALVTEQKYLAKAEKKSRFLHNLIFGSMNKRIADPKTDNDWLSCNEENVAKYNADEKCGFVFTVNGFATLFELIARSVQTDNLEKVPKDLPIFWVSGEQDPIGTYGDGVKAAYDALDDVGLEHQALKLYEGDRHEILHEDDKAQVMQDLYDWMCRKLPEAVL